MKNLDKKKTNDYDENLFHHQHEKHTIQSELMHHLPYAIFSVALGMVILSLLDYTARSTFANVKSSCSGYHLLFHSFHFLHILFAATGAVVTYARFSRDDNLLKTILIGSISPTFFCILSDVILPYLSGLALGVRMELHICFYKEMQNVFPFLFVGVLNGLILKVHHTGILRIFSLGSHFTHILISSLASLFYLVSHGLSDWYPKMGYIFIFLVLAIVIPCTFSDVIIPMYFAGLNKK